MKFCVVLIVRVDTVTKNFSATTMTPITCDYDLRMMLPVKGFCRSSAAHHMAPIRTNCYAA